MVMWVLTQYTHLKKKKGKKKKERRELTNILIIFRKWLIYHKIKNEIEIKHKTQLIRSGMLRPLEKRPVGR